MVVGLVKICLFYLLFPCIALPVEKEFIFNAYPKSQYEHFLQRDAFIQAEEEFENRNWNLSKDERIADHYLAYLKWNEFKTTGLSGFPPLKPIEKTLDHIVQTELYQILSDLPKGGNLHSHEDHQLSKKILFDIIWDSEDFENLYIVHPNASKNAWKMDFFVNPPNQEPWLKVKESELTKKEILQRNTLLGLLTPNATNNPTDSSLRWQLINPLWGRASVQLISNVNIRKKYLWALYEQSISEGVFYLETRRSFGLDLPLYVLDRSGQSNKTNGKRFLDPSYELDVTLAIDVSKTFASQNPVFIGHKRISYASRSVNLKTFQSVMETTLKLRTKYPQHVIGFDAVGEEDAGHSTLYYLDNYLSLYQGGKSAMPLYLHSVETSWPEDLMTSKFEDDLVSTLQNGYESLILQAKRIGHGKGLIKKPFLRQVLRSRKTAVEICIVSNQILGMDPDVRNHYGQVIFKEGIPIVLAPDDPGTFGYDNVTVDWYMAYLAWGLNIGDLKQIALNSLVYNGMTEYERKDAIINKWQPSWGNYINKIKLIACKKDFTGEGRQVLYNRLLPSSGVVGTKVHIFGQNFQTAICKVPKCRFGTNLDVDAQYISNHQLSCVAPPFSECSKNSSAPLSVALDGNYFEITGLNFVYLDDA